MTTDTRTRPLWEARRIALRIHFGLSISYGTTYGSGDGYGYRVRCTECVTVVDEGDGLSPADIADLPVRVAKEAGIDLDELDEHTRYYR